MLKPVASDAAPEVEGAYPATTTLPGLPCECLGGTMQLLEWMAFLLLWLLERVRGLS